jgi:hypothetical protein
MKKTLKRSNRVYFATIDGKTKRFLSITNALVYLSGRVAK